MLLECRRLYLTSIKMVSVSPKEFVRFLVGELLQVT